MYYLQSRYYDPAVGRFINADEYASTGQGFIGYNMFAYCNNAPINFIDPSGELAFPGQIHHQIVKRIYLEYGYNKEQKILYEDGNFGRADLISPDGQVWDVKPDKPYHIHAGQIQVEKYVFGTWVNYPNVELSVGGGSISGDTFYYKSGLTTYKVSYRNAGNGVIAYNYSVKNYDYETLAAAAAITVAFVAAAYFAAGLAGAAGVLAISYA